MRGSGGYKSAFTATYKTIFPYFMRIITKQLYSQKAGQFMADICFINPKSMYIIKIFDYLQNINPGM